MSIFFDYAPCKECTESAYNICYKCGKCGRKFEVGVLLNGDEYPGYYPDGEEDD